MSFCANSTDIFRIFATLVFVAQLVEQLTLNQWVQGSSPCQDTNRGVAQLASAPRSGRGGRKFESSHPDFFL